MASTNQTWVVAFFHHAPYSKGSHDSDNGHEMIEMRQNILPILENYGVDLVFAGHSHSYERSFLIDGHYGSSSTLSNSMKIDTGDGRTDGDGAYSKGYGPHLGTVYMVAGVSSTVNEGMQLNHPVMIYSHSLLGSVILDINNQNIETKFLDKNGIVQDYFTLNKNGSPGNLAPFVSLTAPAPNVFYTAPADILIEADASDNDGSIALVEFFANGSKIDEVAISPYRFVWNNVGVGTYSLSVKASDNEAAATTSSIRTVTVTGLSSGTTTFETRISAGSDDVEEHSNGSMYMDSSDIELVNNGTRGDQKIGLRFNNISIPADAVVTNAYIQFQTDETVNVSGSIVISGEASADAAAFSSTTGDVSNRLLTASSVSWSPPVWNTIGEAGVDQRTPDLTSVVQEILEGGSWTINKSMVFVITGTGERVAESYEGSVGAAALLHIDYEDGLPGNAPPSISLMALNNDTSYTPPAEITLHADASDSDGLIALVEFFANGNKIGEDTSSPYSFVWNKVAVGSYQLTAKATDDQGASKISTVVLADVEQENTVFEVRISADFDDVEERSNGRMYMDSGDIELVNNGERGDQVIGLRFRNIAIPQGASISASYIQFKVDEAKNNSGTKTIEAHDTGDAPVFISSNFNVSSRSRTTASADWNPPSWTSVGVAGPEQQTSDISAVLQDIINRPDWNSGNNIVIIISGTGLRVAESYEGDASGAALLHVEY